MRRALVLAAAALLAGCAASGGREPERYYVLEAASRPAVQAPVRVAPTSSAGFYDTRDIVFSRAAGTRAYYQFSHWTEPPARAIHAQIASRLDAGAGSARFVLRTHLEEIYHDAVETPGAARIAMTAELADPASGRVLGRRALRHAAPAASHDAAGAVEALRSALGALLDDLAAWVEAVHADQTARSRR